MACANHQMSSQKFVQESTQEVRCKVNLQIERNAIPKTPKNMSLPKFGQNVIGWATGPEGAKNRLENIQKLDLKAIQEKGTTLAMVKEWQAFYENEVQRNSCNPTAPYRAELMKKIAELWVD
ncbi:DUF4951 domain-containing protein [Acinetobacter sp. ANC 4779]|nr:DUF4951 domain-containing protein [Acinetobacter sp. ANC 4779]